MVNKILAVSSLFMFKTTLHFKQSLLKKFYLLGTITSILNHSFTKKELIYLDRFVMGVGVFVDTYFINKSKNFKLYFLSLASVLSYFTAKKTGNIFFHLNAHYLITILHKKLN
jgi:hypothetical protein